MMWFELGLSTAVLFSYCAVNAAVLVGLWQILRVGSPAAHALREVFLKTGLSVVIVWALTLLVSRMFCWSAFLAQCLECTCPLTSMGFLGQTSSAAVFLFLVCATFVQLTLIAIPVRLSRMLFVLTVIASNVVAGLLTLGLAAVLG